MKGIAREAAAVALAVAAGSQPAPTQRFACFAIQPGDTAALLASRLTGDMSHRREPWFQIIEPATERPIPKNRYSRIFPGRRVCVAEGRLRPEWVAPSDHPSPLLPEPAPSLATSILRLTTPAGAAIGSAALLSLAGLLAWHLAALYSSSRRAVVLTMTVFGERFVREFERPLRRPGSDDRAVESRLRLRPGQRRLDILLAPHDGHSYPNLSDHRRNVEYDIGRVLRQLKDERFVSERLSRHGRWVIVRCRFRADLTSGGGP